MARLAPPSGSTEQFASLQQEQRIGRFAEMLIPLREGFVDQHAAGNKGVKEMGQQRAMQIVGHDDASKTLSFEWPGSAAPQRADLEVDLNR